MLLDSDVDIDLQDELGGNTRLMDASAVGNYDVVDLLIKHGADINLKNNYGKTALYIASVNRKNDIVDLLKKHGAKE
jgi:ankyrin repeat protein